MALLKSGGRLNGNLRRPVKRWNSRKCEILKRGLVNTSTEFDGIPILKVYREACARCDEETALALAATVWEQRARALRQGRLDLDAADKAAERQGWRDKLDETLNELEVKL